jgi:hypothetical protein
MIREVDASLFLRILAFDLCLLDLLLHKVRLRGEIELYRSRLAGSLQNLCGLNSVCLINSTFASEM